jgi:hypothetical protein
MYGREHASRAGVSRPAGRPCPPLLARAGDRARGHGHRVPRARRAAGAARRDQAARALAVRAARHAASLPARGAHRGAMLSPAHRADTRGGGSRRPRGLRPGIRARRRDARGAGAPARAVAGGRRAARGARGGLGARVRARPRRHPSRREAREHPDRGGQPPRADRGLRHRAVRRSHANPGVGRSRRHGALHGAGTGRGRASRWARGPLRARGHALRQRDRPGSVPCGERGALVAEQALRPTPAVRLRRPCYRGTCLASAASHRRRRECRAGALGMVPAVQRRHGPVAVGRAVVLRPGHHRHAGGRHHTAGLCCRRRSRGRGTRGRANGAARRPSGIGRRRHAGRRHAIGRT